MNTRQLIIRSLLHYWRTGIAVVVGLAIACAVIVGSLVIGDSVRGSIRDTALARLGHIDYALVAPHFFREQLAADLTRDKRLAGRVKHISAAVITRGSADNATTDAAVPSIGVIGIDDSFWHLWPTNTTRNLHLTERKAAISQSLAQDLNVKPGDSILINIDKQSAVPSGTLFERRSREDTVSSMRLEVSTILPDNGVGGFKLDSGTDAPRNVFVSREWLCSEIGKQNQANALLIGSNEAEIGADLKSALTDTCTLADYGLKLVRNPGQGYTSLQSEGMLLTDSQANAAQSAAGELHAQAAPASVYLATTIKKQGSPSGIPYSIVAAGEPLVPFTFRAGASTISQTPDPKSIWLNTWAADDLKAKIGDKIDLVYLVSKPDGTYREDSITLSLTGIVEMTGPANDRGIVPVFEGITDAQRIDEWSAPFPVDLDRIRPTDETYWDNHKTTPKAFISLDTARTLWTKGSSTSAGWVTSVRIRPKTSAPDLAKLETNLSGAIEGEIPAQDAGMVFRPIRQSALAASTGTTDFGQLFLGMSFFLLIAGAGLAGTLMRLSSERRASEAGIMMACGFDPGKTRKTLFGEGICLTIIGTLLGVPLGVIYAAGIMAALRSWWIGAVGTSALCLHITPASVLVGCISGLIVGAISVHMGIAKLSHSRVLDLLSGWQSMAVMPEPSARAKSKALLIGSLIATAAFLGLSIAQPNNAPAFFFACGAFLLIAGLSAADLALTRARSVKPRFASIRMLALRSAAANRSRSLLVIGLIATASFMIVAVAANTRNFSRTDYTQKSSGTGGFALRAVSSLPIRYDFGTPEGRKALGFPPEDEAVFNGVKVYRLLMSPGDDVSCLNLAKPTQPRLLGISPEFANRGGFTVTTANPSANPWAALEPNSATNHIPIFGDADSVMWSLHSGLGQSLTLKGDNNSPTKAQFTGLIHGSIFAGELITSEAHFKSIFPSVTDPRYFLIDAPTDKVSKVAQSLRENLGDMGLQIRTTRELLNSYIGVQNTYLSVFLALGGLGLMLGTFGLVAVLLRSALERKREFALMLATGLTTAHIARMLMMENAGLLIYGLICGTISALVAVAPHVLSAQSGVSWGMIAAALTIIAAIGLISCALAAKHVVNGTLVQALREE